ncbi:MAG: ferredoxin [Roseicyclus sp.]|nr:ferredoxin [Roseicyclus sp.]
MDYETLQAAAEVRHLSVVGAFHPDVHDTAPEGTLLLLAPREPGFWPHFTASPEYTDGAPDPMDRWSTRVVSDLANATGAVPIFPFGGPPYSPFITWAKNTGRIHKSPVTLLVHDKQGLMISFRGALAIPHRLDLPPPPLSPCLLCHSPCEDACPVDALSEDGYDTAACHAFLDTPAGANCIENGCKARRACPVSQDFARIPAQSAFHMQSFHK